MTDLNLWERSGDNTSNYLTFEHNHEDLARIFTEKSDRDFSLYGVEHVLWFKGGDPFNKRK